MRILVVLLSLILAVPFAGLSRAIASEMDDAMNEESDEAQILRAEEILVETEVVTPAEVYLDTPVETEVITGEELATLPATNAIDALDAIPGIRIIRRVQGQRGAVRIDGLPPEFTEILVNGQRYSGENGEAIDLGDQLFANIDRIEILRGPQALRYTARAAGGVINIITQAPPTDGARISGEAGGGDQEQAEFETNAGWGNDLYGFDLTYDYNQEAGFDTPSKTIGKANPSPFGEGSLYRTHDVYGTLRARPSDAIDLTTRLGYRLRDDALAVNDEPVSARRETDRFLLSQDARVRVSDSTEMYGTFTFSNEDTRSTIGRDVQITDQLARLEFGAEHARELFSGFHVLTVGVDVSTVGIEVDEGPIPPEIDNPDFDLPDIQERFSRGAGFAVLESEWTDWMQTELGLRYEVRENFKPELLPQAALLLKPRQWDEHRSIKLRLSAGQAVRYPTLRELFQPPAPQVGAGYFLAGSEDLDSEKAFAVRAGIEANPWRAVSASVVGFYSQTTDRIRAFNNGNSVLIGTTVIPANAALCALGSSNPAFLIWCSDRVAEDRSAIFENRNLDDFEAYGVEVRVELRPSEWVELNLGYTWNRNLVTDSNVDLDELPNAPRHIASARLRLTAPVFGTVLTARGQWRDEAIVETSGTGLLSFAGNRKSDPSFDVDLRVLQPLDRWLHQRMDLFVDARNVTDNRVIDSNVVRGRSFLAGLKWNFE